MTHHVEDFNHHHPAVECLLRHGFEGAAQAFTLLMNEAMKIERSQALQAAPYERTDSRQGYANGFKPKTVTARVGKLALEIPQVRGELDFYPTSLEKGLRSEQALNLAIAEMYIQGVSTRKMDKVIRQLCGEGVSREKVSQLSQQMDEELERWRSRPLGNIPYLILDARYEKVRVDGLVQNCAVLIAFGVTGEGRRSVLGVSVALSEAEVHWRDFLRTMKVRGLHGLKMITSDDHSGLRAALKTEFGGVKWQRCQFHLQQNAAHYVPKIEMRKEVASDIRAIFNAPNLNEAQRLMGITTEKYKETAIRLTKWMTENLHEGFSVFALPEEHRKKLRTSNLAERQNEEIKRRTRVIGIFPNSEALLRISTCILKEVSERWETGKVYLKVEDAP